MIAALATTLLVSTAMAQSIDAPTMKVGDRHVFRTAGGPERGHRWTQTVLEVLPGGGYVTRYEPDAQAPQLRHYDRDGNMVVPPPWPTLRSMQFPIDIGKSWTHAVNDTPAQTRTIAYRAVAREPYASGVGRLDCVRIEGVETTGNTGVVVPIPVKLWYCPAARAVVRKESRIPTVGLVTLDLVEYKLAP